VSELIEIERARELVLARAATLPSEPVTLAAALGRVLAEDVSATEPAPPFDSSAMDGYAVRAGDTTAASPAEPVQLRIVGESRAGAPAACGLAEGEAIGISTGAMLPEGADAIVRLEDSVADGALVAVRRAVRSGGDIRRAGEDMVAGALVMRAGTELGPSELGVLATLARPEVSCVRRPTVAVITTGDELIGPDQPYRPGATRNSNAYSVPALAERSGAVVSLRQGVGDELEATREAIAAAVDRDVLVLCGGVSVGPHDHVRDALVSLGVEEVFWRIALRPGKPTWFGVSPTEGLVFGLPGNPVSAMVTFLLLVQPALRKLQGLEPARDVVQSFLEEDYTKPPGRAHALRCRLAIREDGWHATPTGPQGSHILTSMLGADGLALIPTDSQGVRRGERVQVQLIARG